MDVRKVIRSQFHAALDMLEGAVTQCPESLWADPKPRNKCWHLAYHALFYTHLYLQDSEKDFVPWTKHRAQINFLGAPPPPYSKARKTGKPYQKEEILKYLEICRKQVDEKVPRLKLDGKSGFSWIPFGKMELQVYNIRHLQHHTGQLIERLRAKEDFEVKWVGRGQEA